MKYPNERDKDCSTVQHYLVLFSSVQCHSVLFSADQHCSALIRTCGGV
jgi:hypothetical protein